MIARKTFCGIQFFISILGMTSNTLRPDHSERILNTENIILLMKDFGEYNTDDLEIIKDSPERFAIDKKLRNFHRFIRAIKATEKTQPNHGFRSAIKPVVSLAKPPFGTLGRANQKRKRRLQKCVKRQFRQGRRRVREKRALTSQPYIVKTDSYLERLYEEFVAACQRNNTAYKYTDKGKPEETVYDGIRKILEVNFPKNCTNVTGVGFDVIKCLLIDIKNGEIDREQIINRVSAISLVWFCIYLAIATILWCAKGWCCCCFRCSFCFPDKTINDIKTYLKENPPGFYRDQKGRVERYYPSVREKELYDVLTKCVEQY